MPGTPPQPSGPTPPAVPQPPVQPPNLSVSAVLPNSPTICGFGIPGFGFNISFKIPGFDFAFPPTWFFALALKCDLSHPIDSDFGFGGGRQGKTGLDQDPEDK